MPSTRTTGASTTPAPTITTAASDTAQRLLSELQHADTIIKTILNAMTVQQKVKVGAQLASGIACEGVTRHHERQAVIDAANAVAPTGTNATGASRHLLSMMPTTSPSAPPLSPTEQRWLDAFRKMDQECAADNLHCMEGMAEEFPRHTKPTLYLVAGGVK